MAHWPMAQGSTSPQNVGETRVRLFLRVSRVVTMTVGIHNVTLNASWLTFLKLALCIFQAFYRNHEARF